MKKHILVTALALVVLGAVYAAYLSLMSHSATASVEANLREESARIALALRVESGVKVAMTYREVIQGLDAEILRIDQTIVQMSVKRQSAGDRLVVSSLDYLKKTQDLLRSVKAKNLAEISMKAEQTVTDSIAEKLKVEKPVSRETFLQTLDTFGNLKKRLVEYEDAVARMTLDAKLVIVACSQMQGLFPENTLVSTVMIAGIINKGSTEK